MLKGTKQPRLRDRVRRALTPWAELPVESTHLLAKKFGSVEGAVFVVLSAHASGIKGLFDFGRHSWIAYRPAIGQQWQVIEITDFETLGYQHGYRRSHAKFKREFHKTHSTRHVIATRRIPDGKWFGAAPEIVFEQVLSLYSDNNRRLRERIEGMFNDAVHEYPHNGAFNLLRCNCNTFVSWFLWRLYRTDFNSDHLAKKLHGFKQPTHWEEYDV